jgi:hypothetical protein
MTHRLIVRAGVLAFGLLGLLAVTFPPAVTTVPFHYVHHELLVHARIGASGPYTFLLDTGTTPSIIDVALVKRLGLPSKGAAAHGTDVGESSITVYPVTLHDVQLGSLRIRQLAALATDISGIGNKLGVHLDGVLGSNFFDRRVVQIDYPCRTVSVLSDAVLAPFAARFTENASGYIITNDVWMGSQRASATIDTGDSGTMLITGTGIAALHLQSTARSGKAVSSVSYGGRHSETEGMLPEVRIGSTVLGPIKARFLPAADDPFDINIGNQTLERFVVTLDYVRGLFTLSPPRSCST